MLATPIQANGGHYVPCFHFNCQSRPLARIYRCHAPLCTKLTLRTHSSTKGLPTMSESSTIRENLAKLAHPQGGWGYAPVQPSHLEPTCLALLALAPVKDRYGDTIAAALRFLEENALPDGGYRLS